MQSYDDKFNSMVKRQVERIAELEKVAEAVLNLPVEEMVETYNGEPSLVGYAMHAQGEWDRVVQALRAAGYLK